MTSDEVEDLEDEHFSDLSKVFIKSSEEYKIEDSFVAIKKTRLRK